MVFLDYLTERYGDAEIRDEASIACMCRSVIEGGRRCPCNSGARRRAYRRARYALRSVEDLMPVAAAESPKASAPTVTVEDARAALRTAALRGQLLDSVEMKTYVSAIIAHGAALRDATMESVNRGWDAEGVSDVKVREILDRQAEHEASKADRDAKAEAILEDQEALRKANPDWHTDPVLSRKLSEMGDEWAALIDDYTNGSVALAKELREINSKRMSVFQRNVFDTLRKERGFGGKVMLTDTVKLSKTDADMLAEVLDSLPSGMIDFANGRGVPLHVKRSKKRAHYSAAEKQKRKKVRSSTMNAAAAVRGEALWHDDREGFDTDGAPPEDRHVPHSATVEDTPQNRAALEQRIAEFKERSPRTPSAKIPRIHSLVFDGQARLAVYVPEWYHTMTSRESAPAGELTFSDKASMAHEMGHHIEHGNIEVGMACKAFLKQRTEGMEKVVYRSVARGKEAEMVTPDGFVDSYIGKHYNGSYATEVFSMGVEALVGGEHGGLMGVEVDMRVLGKEPGVPKTFRADPEHFALIMGLLANANIASTTGDVT